MDDNIELIGELSRAPEELFLEDRAVDLIRRAAKALLAKSEVISEPVVFVKPLEWRDRDHGFFVAEAPLFGNIRVENYGEDFHVLYSTPGYCDTFVEGAFRTSDQAKAAAEAEYQRRMQLSLAINPKPVTSPRMAPFASLCCGARFRYGPSDDTVWVKIGHDLVAKWDADLVADTWIGQPIRSFSEDGDQSRVVYLEPDSQAALPQSYERAPISTSDLAELLTKV